MLRYWPTRSETFVAAEIDGLRRRGVEVVVAAIGEREDGEGLDPVPGLEVWRPPRGLGRAKLWPVERGIRAENGEWTDWLDAHQRPKDTARACWVAEQARGFDRIHAHFAGEAAEWARFVSGIVGAPYSVTVHATDLFRPRPSLAEVLAGARPVVTVCDHHRRWIAERYRVEARVVRCGVDPGRFPAADPGRTGTRAGSTEPLQVVAVARWVAKKGLDTVLQAMDQVREAASLRLVSNAPPGVPGAPLPPDEIPAVLQQSDVFALPCRVAPSGDRDGVPVALIEAMAAGLPVVTTDVSGIGELVDERVGWLVQPDDPEGLARTLDAIARDPAERSRRGRAGRQRIREAWTLEHQVDGLLDAWGAS